MSRLKDYFKDRAKAMLTEYETSKGLSHSGSKGSAREIFVQQFLKSCFPSKFIFNSGEILDSTGTVSPQSDVVVYDGSMPLLPHGTIHQYLAEGVMAHIEVKSTLDSNQLKDALNKCSAVQKLAYKLKPNMYMGALRDHIPSYIFAYEGPKSQTFKDNILDFVNNNPGAKLPQGIFVLSPGYVAILQDTKLIFGLTADETLTLFFTRLNDSMWKSWSGYPDLYPYIGSLNYPIF